MNLYDVYSLYPVTPVKGKGCFVYDEKGKEYLDFYGGHAVISIGHSHPHYISTISDQLENIAFYSNSVINPLQQKLANKIESLSGLSGYDLFLINSGAEANENALKLASFYNNRKSVLALENSFHGRTSGAINVTHTGIKHQAPINQGIQATYCNHQDVDKILSRLDTREFACMIIEPIQGVGGLESIDIESLRHIQSKCDETNTILIMDEVQSGYGRSGKFFAFQYSDIQPDIITIAKGMGNGFPIGGVLINPKKIPPVKSRLGTTYGGNHLACAAGIAVLEIMDNENLVGNAEKQGIRLKQELAKFPGVVSIKGKGLMLGMEFENPVSDLRRRLIFEHQVFTGSSANPNLLRILPPLCIRDEEVELFLSKLTDALIN